MFYPSKLATVGSDCEWLCKAKLAVTVHKLLSLITRLCRVAAAAAAAAVADDDDFAVAAAGRRQVVNKGDLSFTRGDQQDRKSLKGN